MPFFQGAKQRCAKAVERAVVVREVHHGQLIRMWHRQRPQQQSIDQREDRRVRAQPQSQRQNRGHGEAGRPAQLPQSEAHVARHLFQERHPPPHAVLLPDLCHAAKLHQRRTPRLIFAQAAFEVLRNGEVDVAFELFIQLLIQPSPPEQSRATAQQNP
jgi:hypothetical protein